MYYKIVCKFCGESFIDNKELDEHLLDSSKNFKCGTLQEIKNIDCSNCEFWIVSNNPGDLDRLPEKSYALYKSSWVYQKIGGFLTQVGKYEISKKEVKF